MKIIKTFFYKLYVIALMALVIWAAQFMYPLIYWEFQFTGVNTGLHIKKGDPDLAIMKKVRRHLDHNTRLRKRNLGDLEFEEHYEKGHFHHVGQSLVKPVLNGCDYCHSTFPHIKNIKTRAYRNMHGYFIACETCHFSKETPPNAVSHAWIDIKAKNKTLPPFIHKPKSDTGYNLPNAKGNYDARIAPWTRNQSIVKGSSIQRARDLLDNYLAMQKSSVKQTIKDMHKNMTKKPITCDGCHRKENPLLAFDVLGYTNEEIVRLQDSGIAAMIKEYEKFHFPDLFIRKNKSNTE